MLSNYYDINVNVSYILHGSTDLRIISFLSSNVIFVAMSIHLQSSISLVSSNLCRVSSFWFFISHFEYFWCHLWVIIRLCHSCLISRWCHLRLISRWLFCCHNESYIRAFCIIHISFNCLVLLHHEFFFLFSPWSRKSESLIDKHLCVTSVFLWSLFHFFLPRCSLIFVIGYTFYRLLLIRITFKASIYLFLQIYQYLLCSYFLFLNISCYYIYNFSFNTSSK